MEDDILTEEQRQMLGTAVSALLPENKRFVLLVAGIDGPTRLEVISDLTGHAGIISLMCKWGADVATDQESEQTAEMLRVSGAQVIATGIKH